MTTAELTAKWDNKALWERLFSRPWIDCIYGPSGSGKSVNILTLIKLMHEATGKMAYVWIGDGSRSTYEESGLVEKGIIQIADYSHRQWPQTTTNQICEGFWPEDPDDESSKLIRISNMEEAVGLVVIEGLSVMSRYLAGNVQGGLAEQASRGIKLGESSPIMSVDLMTDDKGNYIPNSGPGTRVGGNPPSHYNIVQQHMMGCIRRTKGLKVPVVWTAHERQGDDKNQGESVIAPELFGKALSAELSREFNHTLHCTLATKVNEVLDATTGKKVKVGQAEYRMYTRDHYDPDGLVQTKYRAVTRVPPTREQLMPEYLAGRPGEAIRAFHSIIAEAREQFLQS